MKIKGFRKTISWYEKNAKKYAESTSNGQSDDQISEFISLIPKGGLILDAGCGSGRDTNIFFNHKYNAIGVDISAGLISIARRMHPKIKFKIEDFRKLSFAENYFDGVWAHASLVHLDSIEDVNKTLSEFKRILKKKGVLHLLVRAQTGAKKFATTVDINSGYERFYQYFKQKELISIFKKMGFRIIKIDQYNDFVERPSANRDMEWILVLARKI